MPKPIEPPTSGASEEERAAYLALLPHPNLWGWHFCPGRHNPLMAISGTQTKCWRHEPIDWARVEREAERLRAGYSSHKEVAA
ncbi:MAG: hypothetical protein KGL39_51060 [Patescibacteria group bacterium]|nr:hypothetical protein [Patescibacteria group bacterium]